MNTNTQNISARIRQHIKASGYCTASFGKPRNTPDEINAARAAIKLVSAKTPEQPPQTHTH
jgi:hypothetical protein